MGKAKSEVRSQKKEKELGAGDQGRWRRLEINLPA